MDPALLSSSSDVNASRNVITRVHGLISDLLGSSVLSWLILEFVAIFLTYELWNKVLYDRIEGIDYITLWDATAIHIFVFCFRVLMNF